MNSQVERYLSGTEAAEFLGVKMATLYAYVSRGLLASAPSENARQRSYKLSDLIKLRQSARGFKARSDADETTWMGPVIKSSITEIREEGHYYRGSNVLDLAINNKPFEEIIELLWDTQNPFSVWKQLKPLSIPKQVKEMGFAEEDSPVDFLDILKLLLVSLEVQEMVPRHLLDVDVFDTAHRLIVSMSMTVGIPFGRYKYLNDGQFPIAATLLSSLSGSSSEEQASLVNTALVLCADHELNAPALSARIAASCGASLYSCLLSALGPFGGTVHGAGPRGAYDLIERSMADRNNIKKWLKDYLRQNESIPGFGTRLYESGDPRAALLISKAQNISPEVKEISQLVQISNYMEELGARPNLDMGLCALSFALGWKPQRASAVFAISRSAGWIAHAVEQGKYGGVIRPRARYIGKTGSQ